MRPEDAIDIGHDVQIELRRIGGEFYGVGYWHKNQETGAQCSGYAPVKPSSDDGWDVVSLEPLTLAPSLLCRACGHHGWIRDGVWVPV
jgi:hypothetical protein